MYGGHTYFIASGDSLKYDPGMFAFISWQWEYRQKASGQRQYMQLHGGFLF